MGNTSCPVYVSRLISLYTTIPGHLSALVSTRVNRRSSRGGSDLQTTEFKVVGCAGIQLPELAPVESNTVAAGRSLLSFHAASSRVNTERSGAGGVTGSHTVAGSAQIDEGPQTQRLVCIVHPSAPLYMHSGIYTNEETCRSETRRGGQVGEVRWVRWVRSGG
ncbi:hypothetical protein EYF80_053421 [Liparis tanakae]|uniref:Uncharacterized protein n=1 Tax=Liparis tanakae TaxID=230148 RepID=A0A4Z2F5I2_9TELE|nr:hypothetical protein EYF80_053421 [Liparis tanakae]